ncbi:MAG: lipopolysaccharide biosynthesis protein [Thermodesulfobacteriota bacterium]
MRKPSQFLTHLFSVYSANAVNGVLGIVAVPLVVGLLGDEKYGIYSIYPLLASYVALIDCGVTKHFIRLMSSAPGADEKADYLRKALGWYLLLAFLLFGSLPLSVYLISRHLFPVPLEYHLQVRWIVVLSAVEYILGIPLMVAQAYTMANLGFGRYSQFTVISGLLRYVLMFFAAWMYHNPAMVVVFLVARRFPELICARFVLLMPPGKAWRPRISFREFLEVLKSSSVMSLAQFLQTTVVSIGTLLLNRHFGIAVLGHYRAAFDLSSKVWFFSNGLGLVVFPKFSQMLADVEERKKLVRKMMLWLEKSLIGYLCLAIMAIAAAPGFLPLIHLGHEQIVRFFMLLILGVCLNAHTNIAYEYMLADNRYGTVAILSASLLIVMVASYLVLMNSSGPDAIAWAWIISQGIYVLAADELVVRGKDDSMVRHWKQPAVKLVMILVAAGFVAMGIRSAVLTMAMTAPFLLLLGYWMIVKDWQELRWMLPKKNG